MANELVQQNGNTKVTEGFQGTTREQSAEMATVAVAAAARAEIESAYIMALKNPRNEEDSRIRILDRCKSLTFAEKAIYKKPVGGGFVEGPSIRFAEEMLRLWRNVKTQQTTIFEDEYKRIVKIVVIDLECNSSYSQEILIEKQVERKDPKGRLVINKRTNTSGQTVYIVAATEDELMNKTQAMASKIIRNNGLRLIPEDIKEDAEDMCRETIKKQIDADPASAKRKITDAFAKLGVYPKDLELYVKCKIENISPAQIIDLKNLYTAINEGQTTWAAVVEEINKDKENGAKDASASGIVGFKKASEKTIVEPPKEPEKPAQSMDALKRETLLAGMKAAKEKMGDEAYFKVLGGEGYENAEQIADMGLLERIYKKMQQAYREKAK